MKRIGLITSGGDAPGMNAAIRAIVKTCLNKSIQPVGYFDGYDGVISNSWKELTFSDVDNIIQRGGTILGTARSEAFRTKEGRSVAIKNLLDNNIDGFICIGGDGSFTGASILSDEMNIPVIGIPGTIDNDIFGTSHTIGYDSALNTVVDVIDKIRDTASSHNRLFFIEVMGKDAGHIALNTGVGAGAEEILIPEENLGLERLVESLKRSKATGKSSSIVIVAEGEGYRLWHRKDDEFNVPKGHLYLSLDSQKASMSPRHATLTRLYVELLLDYLTESTYQAEVAGLNYNIYPHQGGITLHLTGFTGNQESLLSLIIKIVF